MRKLWMRGALGVWAMAAVSACGAEAPEVAAGPAGISGVVVLSARSELQNCSIGQRGTVYYLERSDEFVYCDGEEHQTIDLHGLDGSDGVDGADGVGWVVTVTEGATSCAAGGVTISAGPDRDGDGAFDVVTSSVVVCHGERGPAGEDGEDGAEGAQGAPGTPGEAGSSCTVTDDGAGTKTITCEDGTVATVSDGADGSDGANGADGESVVVTVEPAGANCESGGFRLESASGVGYVCNGEDGADGADGVDGATGATGPAGPAGPPGPAGDGSAASCGGDPASVYEDVPLSYSSAGGGARGDTSSRFLLELSPSDSGPDVLVPLVAVGGGNAVADVVLYTDGQSQQKRPGAFGFQDIVLIVRPTAALSSGSALRSWISGALTLQESYISGAIVEVDTADSREKGRLEFQDARLDGLVLPELSVGCRDAGWLALRLAPTYTIQQAATGSRVQLPAPPSSSWMNERFTLTVGDLPTGGVLSVSSLSVRRVVTGTTIGGGQFTQQQTDRFDIANLTLTVSGLDAADWLDWEHSFILQGNASEANHQDGHIALLDGPGSEFLGFDLWGMGILAYADVTALTEDAPVNAFQVELYTQEVEVQP